MERVKLKQKKIKSNNFIWLFSSIFIFVVFIGVGSYTIITTSPSSQRAKGQLISTSDEENVVPENQANTLEESDGDSSSEEEIIFYENIATVANGDSTLVLVNKNNVLDSTYAPTDLVLPDVLVIGHQQNRTVYMREEAAYYLEQLFEAAYDEAGLVFLARSGYRSYETQVELYQRYVELNGQEEADHFSARAGHSEHQTGLAIDVTADSVNGQLVTEFVQTAEGIWLKENAHRFGFIIRYLEGREDETGYQYEPWHIRYVGKEVAEEIYQNDWIFEQYLNKHKEL